MIFWKPMCGRPLSPSIKKKKKRARISSGLSGQLLPPFVRQDKMATFERCFLAEKETHEEKKNPYYRFLENDQVVENIFKEFGITGTAGTL